MCGTQFLFYCCPPTEVSEFENHCDKGWKKAVNMWLLTGLNWSFAGPSSSFPVSKWSCWFLDHGH